MRERHFNLFQKNQRTDVHLSSFRSTKRATQAYREKNRDKTREHSAKSSAKSYINKYCDLDDLAELKSE
ncbi:hypothetical protein ABD90_17125 [Lysinibacillus fusiformis]|uniref:Uncharacterized protein n=1 Tax=Lysinibacillus sphaericus CBAM5 TaxID=1400869 RepID=W7RKL0_LYSSH|nr:hypothetical protein AR327_08685 [Lysinibacillus sphaericus]EWH32062.1 hypothetical protein P799_16020 [Lysinibacillus sphaericus CBAM5]MBG9726925.1 hypothetical protein [Lysinibacillus fusiformis]AMR92400.1 hypothetical protein A1T07_20525 [Lysinibacillus sphaericus]ANA46449.1 hypothetical protein A2J09_13195 [Lysinibacillus sphaericus]